MEFQYSVFNCIPTFSIPAVAQQRYSSSRAAGSDQVDWEGAPAHHACT